MKLSQHRQLKPETVSVLNLVALLDAGGCNCYKDEEERCVTQKGRPFLFSGKEIKCLDEMPEISKFVPIRFWK